MRLVCLVLAGLLIGGYCTALAQAPCDQTCAVIKRAVGDQKSNFASLKGKVTDISDRWHTNVTPPGMGCYLFYNHDYSKALPKRTHPKGEPFWEFNCGTLEANYYEGKKQLKSILEAFRLSAPNWKWFEQEGLSGTDYYGGPTRNELYASVILLESTESVSSANLELHSTPMIVGRTLSEKPYTPR